MRAGLIKWLPCYNPQRPHSTHGILTPTGLCQHDRTVEISGLNETRVHLNKAANWSKNKDHL
jgi:hypothetical protein